ncbi:MAG: MFS transporter [Methanobacteriota archaeon]
MNRQILHLALVNAFVGGMVGLERTILPLIAEEDFGIASKAAAISFIVTFGISKSIVNFLAGELSERLGRRRVLLAGWLVGIPVPLLVMWAPSWEWILFANVLLGVNQGLAWSMTVVMKVDLARPGERGLVLGLNQFAGYIGVASIAFVSGLAAARYGLRPEPFYIGVALAAVGLVLSSFTRETRPGGSGRGGRSTLPLGAVFQKCTFEDRRLAASSLAGLGTNLKDGMLWGLLPLFLAARDVPVATIGLVAALYPAAWGASQLVFGPLSDRVGRRRLIVPGLLLQGFGTLSFTVAPGTPWYVLSALVTGIGTAMAYPVLLALVSDSAEAGWRASALGVYRFWRDSGYWIGALGGGLLADAFGTASAFEAAAGFCLVAAVAVALSTEVRTK